MSNTRQPHQPRGGVSGCFAGKPFEATFHRSGPLDANLWVSGQARDRSGSIRTDLSDGQYTFILDCSKQQSISLVHQAKLAVITPVVLEGTTSHMAFHQFPSPTNDFEIILNVACRRILLCEDKEATTRSGEIWVSDDLGIVMRDIEGSLK